MFTFLGSVLLFGIGAGIIGPVYRLILAYENILGWWFRFGNRFEKKWFFRPVWECEKCFSGQLALWFYLAIWILPRILRHYSRISTIVPMADTYAAGVPLLLFGLILAVSVAITVAVIIGKLHERFINN